MSHRRQGRTSLHEISPSTDAVFKPNVLARECIARSRIARSAWFVAGWLAVAIGGVGVAVPGLPTTGFMIIAAACFARCSPRFEQWILDLPGVGRSVANYRAGLGMPIRAKFTAISMMVIAISFSVGLLLDNTVARASVTIAGLIGVWYILRRVPTGPPASATETSEPS